MQNDESRFNDLDDLKSIFQAGLDIDIPYICGQMQRLKLLVSDNLKNIVPKAILLTSKRVRREFRKGYHKILPVPGTK